MKKLPTFPEKKQEVDALQVFKVVNVVPSNEYCKTMSVAEEVETIPNIRTVRANAVKTNFFIYNLFS